MNEIIKLIKELARKHGVNVYDIKIQLAPEGFLLIWNHIEGGTKEDDTWKMLDSININNIK